MNAQRSMNYSTNFYITHFSAARMLSQLKKNDGLHLSSNDMYNHSVKEAH